MPSRGPAQNLSNIPRLALTPGEPAGIGADLCVQLAQQKFDAQLVVIGDPELLFNRAKQLRLSLQIQAFRPEQAPTRHRPGNLWVKPVSLRAPVEYGQLDVRNASYVLDTLRLAVEGCMQGNFSGLVTGPVQKSVINAAGIPFSGHTEFFAELSGCDVVMMLMTKGLRVALASTHLPLKDISAYITQARLEKILRILHRGLTLQLGITDPHILVCGLNPHAGESGHIGREEIDVIEPVLVRLRNDGMRLQGPLPADTLFIPKYLQHADAVLAMYHDQGLPVLKHMGFGHAINVTLGLPFVRTSVDHGTALDLAGTGSADPASFIEAIHAAIAMAHSVGCHH